jgi:hypothetical protein
MSFRRKIFTAGLVALATTATGLVAVPAHAAAAQPASAGAAQPLNFAAIGDSFASGQGDIGAGWIDPAPCYRSAGAAPQQAAALLNSVRPVDFTSVACNGATVEDLLAPGTGQLAQVDPGRNDPVDALSISIGGNDVGFADVVTDCVTGDPCSTNPAVVNEVNTGFANLEGNGTPQDPGLYNQLINAVNSRSDIDNVFVTEYPDPTTGPLANSEDPGGYCGVPGPDPSFEGFDLITQPEAQWASVAIISELNRQLANMVIRANEAAGPHPKWFFVSGIASAFAGHGYCTGGLSPNPATWLTPRYINTPIDSQSSQDNILGSMHPNDLGQQVMAGVMYSAYTSVQVMSAQVSESSMPVAQALSSFSVTALTFTGKPVAGASVYADGYLLPGQTGSDGVLNASYAFPAAGPDMLTVQAPGYPAAHAEIVVAPRPVTATANPSPVPANTVVPSVSLTATDGLTGQLVAGTFTLTSGAGTWTVRSGASATNVDVTILGWQTEGVPGPNGKPIQIKVPICPTLKFQPDNSSLYAPQAFSGLLTCKPVT